MCARACVRVRIEMREGRVSRDDGLLRRSSLRLPRLNARRKREKEKKRERDRDQRRRLNHKNCCQMRGCLTASRVLGILLTLKDIAKRESTLNADSRHPSPPFPPSESLRVFLMYTYAHESTHRERERDREEERERREGGEGGGKSNSHRTKKGRQKNRQGMRRAALPFDIHPFPYYLRLKRSDAQFAVLCGVIQAVLSR